jgi:hypothetical protein
MSQLQTALINFQHTELLTARDTEGKIFVALKPLVNGMGLDWKSQYAKIKNDSRFNCGDNTMVGLDGKNREMVTLNLDHLPAYLYSINPNRVKKELRDTIIAFQSETFSVINNYWRGKREEPQITITNTTDKERLGTLETQLYMVKNENRELRRAINRITYNDNHLPKPQHGLQLGEYVRTHGNKTKADVYYVSSGLVHFMDDMGQHSVKKETFVRFFEKI